ncbi:ferredoxin [Gracilibacillus oryzae]|uniref:Ferredoxin n=1 Tax=Gracilibacillus oryzae TaxID=1672701 RepID=A0A7C8L8P4_9BACI|nr:ferredoxin [Gracilibacillus oryzae]KAB8138366.1 ferredoxin [Gracilibacillus oryzae]
MPYYTWVDKETCIACGVCGATASRIFDYDDEGLAFSKLDSNSATIPVPADDESDFIDAFESCPTESIKKSSTPEL